MDHGFQVGANQPLKSPFTSRPPEVMFEEKLTEYARSTSRTLPESPVIRQAFNQLKAQKLTLTALCKQLLNSTRTTDLQAVGDIAKALNIALPKEDTTVQTKQTNQHMTQGNNASKQSPDTPPATLTIIQTSANEQLLAGEIIRLIRDRNSKDSLSKLNSNKNILGSVLDAFDDGSKLTVQELKALLFFLDGVLANIAAYHPEAQEKAKKKYDQIKKILEDATDTDAVEDDPAFGTLSEEAQAFVRSFRNLSRMVGDWDGELPQDISDAYHELLGKLQPEDESNT